MSKNYQHIRENNPLGATSSNWLKILTWVLARRFEPERRDRPLVELARAGCSREVWGPLLLWHITRDEFLLRDFLINWLYPEFVSGTYQIRTMDLVAYLKDLPSKNVKVQDTWTENTLMRVASGLLQAGTDFGLLRGKSVREFVSYHLPEESFLYLLHAIHEIETNPRKVVDSDEWRIYLMAPDDVEQELFRLHQYRKIEFESAGSLARLKLPCSTAAEYARRLVA